MAITRQKKVEIVSKVTDALKDAQAVVFVKFHKLTVANANAMRRGLRGAGVGYTVAKKTLIRRVLADMKISGEIPALEGEIAVAYSTDMIAPAKSVAEFAKKFKEQVMSVGGIFEGRYIGSAEVNQLASIPSREVLYGQFVTILNAPIQQTVTTLHGVVRSFVSALDQIAKSKA